MDSDAEAFERARDSRAGVRGRSRGKRAEEIEGGGRGRRGGVFEGRSSRGGSRGERGERVRSKRGGGARGGGGGDEGRGRRRLEVEASDPATHVSDGVWVAGSGGS